jgi:hypothetical protein
VIRVELETLAGRGDAVNGSWSAVKAGISAYIGSASGGESQQLWACAKQAEQGWAETRGAPAADGPEAAGLPYVWAATRCAVGYLLG